MISQANTDGSAIARTVVNTAPISTMNMTGLLPQRARVELAQRVRQRRHSCVGSSRPPPMRRRRLRSVASPSVAVISAAFRERAEREGGR